MENSVYENLHAMLIRRNYKITQSDNFAENVDSLKIVGEYIGKLPYRNKQITAVIINANSTMATKNDVLKSFLQKILNSKVQDLIILSHSTKSHKRSAISSIQHLYPNSYIELLLIDRFKINIFNHEIIKASMPNKIYTDEQYQLELMPKTRIPKESLPRITSDDAIAIWIGVRPVNNEDKGEIIEFKRESQSSFNSYYYRRCYAV